MAARSSPVSVARDRRRLHRYVVSVAAYLSGSILRRRQRAVLKDINAFGCRATTAGRFNAGDFVMISVAWFGPFGASVIWARDGDVGLEFARALDPAVVTAIVQLKAPIMCPIERRWRSLNR